MSLSLERNRGQRDVGPRDRGAAGVAFEQGRRIDEGRSRDVERNLGPGDAQMQEHRLILGLHLHQGVAAEFVGKIAAQIGPAYTQQFRHRTPVVRGGVVEDPAQEEGRVVPPVVAVQIDPISNLE